MTHAVMVKHIISDKNLHSGSVLKELKVFLIQTFEYRVASESGWIASNISANYHQLPHKAIKIDFIQLADMYMFKLLYIFI